MPVSYPTLEHVAMEARPYPAHLLEGCETGLCLFAAAFLGHNDAIHFAEAGINTVCVDIDGERLAQMAELYKAPSDVWMFRTMDAWEYAEEALALGEKYDAVSVDTFTGDVMRRSHDSLELWCSLARKVVTVTLVAPREWPSMPSWVDIPEGWEWSLHPRSGTVYWLVLTR